MNSDTDVYVLLTQYWPHIVVTAIGLVIGLAEVVSTFPNSPKDALSTFWAWLLAWVNAAFAFIVFLIVQSYSPDADLLVLVFTVGFGFPVIIRTRLTLAKPLGPSSKGDVSLNLSWVYDQFQNLCKTQIDLKLLNNKLSAVKELTDNYSLETLKNYANWILNLRKTLSSKEQKEQLDELTTLFRAGNAKLLIAEKIVEYAGQPTLDYLLSQSEPELRSKTDRENLINQIVAKYKLSELVDQSRELLLPQYFEYVEQVAEDGSSEESEDQRKITIARWLLDKSRVDVVESRLFGNSDD